MIKYPSLYTVKEFVEVVERVPEILDMDAYVEPKFDGSNITVMEGVFRTRNLNPLPKRFADGLRSALRDKFSSLLELSRKYQVFLELGGERNSPAGYVDPWDGRWDYRIFDLAVGSGFLLPEEVGEICDEYGLKFVGYEKLPARVIVEEWRKQLSEYRIYEGFVVKIFPLRNVLEKIPHHRQYNMVVAKVKHEYLGIKLPQIRKKKATAKRETEEKPELPPSEILGAINKAHLQLGEKIFDKRKAMPLIFRLVREEAEKHKSKAPSASKLFKYYMYYLEKTKKTR